MGPFDAHLLTAAIALATPIVLAATGELVAQRSGVINVGLEGMMLAGAFLGFWTAWTTDGLLLGVLGGAAAGTLLAAVMGVLSIRARADQIVVGIGINILAGGITTFAGVHALTGDRLPAIEPMAPLPVPGLERLPAIGAALFEQVPLAYLAYLLVPVVWVVLYRTSWGLLIRAAGEAPAAVDTAGVSVVRVRALATLFAGGMAGLGGAMLSVGNLGIYNDHMTAGRGFIALAAVILGRWRPLPVLAACLLFGGADALQLRLQASRAIPLPPELWLMLPYVLTLLVLAGLVDRTRMPSALGHARP